jgi:acetylornithine deacetylase
VPTLHQAVRNQIADLIGMPSVSSVSPEWDMSNLPVIDYLAARLESRGFRIMMQNLPGSPPKANLIATLGRGEGGLVLAGHTDTVPCDESRWATDPFTANEREGRIYGLGTADMKSFLALAMAAAEGLDAAQLTQPLIILATADEESSMAGARALAASGAPKARYAVIGEPTGLKPVRMHKGIFMERVRIQGSSGHSSNPALGNSALDGMHQVLNEIVAWRQELQAQAHNEAFGVPVTTVNLGRIQGGDNPNRICGSCELDLDCRPVPGLDCVTLRRSLHRRVTGILTGSSLGVDFVPLFEGVEPMETDAAAEIVTAVEAWTGARAGAVDFATEAPFLQSMGMEVVVVGPGNIEQAHQPDEFLDLASLEPTLELLRALIRRYCLVQA